jgi:predicted Zn-dependent protease with MMP-like domain
MTEQEIKVKSLELAVSSLSLLSESELTRRMKEKEGSGDALPKFVILYSQTFQDYIAEEKT